MAAICERVTEAIRTLSDDMRRLDPSVGDGSLGVMARYLYLAQYRWVHELLERELDRGASLLDWGAGVGHFAYVQQRLGRRVTAYTLTPSDYNCYNDALAALAKHAGFAVTLGTDPVKLPFPEGAFDAVVSCGVLEHVREIGGDESASLREIERVTKPNGRFYCLHFPNRNSWIELLNRRLGRSHHSFTYAQRDIERLAAESGFAVVRHRRYGVLPKIAMSRLFGRLADSRVLVDYYYRVDAALSAGAAAVAQNHFFVLQKRMQYRFPETE